MMKRSAFSLIEMLVAMVLAAVLMSAVLAMVAGASRDRRLLTKMNNDTRPQGIINLLEWDLSNAQTLSQGSDGQILILTGHNAINPSDLEPNGRLVKVTYLVSKTNNVTTLWRQQEYLDDPVKPQPWQEWVCADFRDLSIMPAPGTVSSALPPKLTVHFAAASADFSQELFTR
jgi:prepilin-type N-terminal cleavage/methylation domain-containing protein